MLEAVKNEKTLFVIGYSLLVGNLKHGTGNGELGG